MNVGDSGDQYTLKGAVETFENHCLAICLH